MTTAAEAYRYYNRSDGYLRRLERAGWQPEYGAVLGALRRFRPQAGGRALDYGCGVGDLTATLRRVGYRAVGADISVPFLASARERHPNIPFVALDSEAVLPFPSAHFTAVTAVNTIEHVAEPSYALKELARVLVPGGLLAMTFPNLASPLRPLKRLFAWPRRPRYGAESGESTSEAIHLLLRNLSLVLRVSFTQRPEFRPRQADLANAELFRMLGYGAHHDAVWLANPADIVWRLRGLGLSILLLRGIPGAAERSRAMGYVRRALPPILTSPILLVARRPGYDPS
jgi:SAM-dependent methyltransferase